MKIYIAGNPLAYTIVVTPLEEQKGTISPVKLVSSCELFMAMGLVLYSLVDSWISMHRELTISLEVIY